SSWRTLPPCRPTDPRYHGRLGHSCCGVSSSASGNLPLWLGLRTAELLQQTRFRRLRRYEGAFLDVAVTADLVRYARQLHRDGVIGGSEFRHDLVELLDVVFDQLPLVPPFVGLAEDVERATAQSLELCEHLEGGQHPGAELPLLQFTGN